MSPREDRVGPGGDAGTRADAVLIQRASPDHLRAVGGLRWDDATGSGTETGTTRAAFAEDFLAWVQDHAATHHGVVGIDTAAAADDGNAGADDGTVVAFGFLAVTPRVPSGDRPRRASADIQSVWVDPERRGLGIGHRLVSALVELAHELGVEHVTVHSSTRAVSLYERVGFAHDHELLNHVP